MNFLSHYYFDGKPGNPYFNLGLALPDMMGIVQRGWKVRYEDLDDFKDLDHQNLSMGIRYHLEMDDFFHQSLFFEGSSSLLKNFLKAKGISNPPFRLFFVSHIFLEILMDRIIAKFKPGIARDFYDELEKINLDKVNSFFKAISSPFYEKFNGFYSSFISSRYIFDYPEDDSFLKALNRIFQRADQPLFDKAQFASIQKSLAIIEELIFINFDKLKLEMINEHLHGNDS